MERRLLFPRFRTRKSVKQMNMWYRDFLKVVKHKNRSKVNRRRISALQKPYGPFRILDIVSVKY